MSFENLDNLETKNLSAHIEDAQRLLKEIKDLRDWMQADSTPEDARLLKEKTEQAKDAIHDCYTSLFEEIRVAGEIKGTKRTYTADEMINTIKSFVDGLLDSRVYTEKDFDLITRANGLREKVKKIVTLEKQIEEAIK